MCVGGAPTTLARRGACVHNALLHTSRAPTRKYATLLLPPPHFCNTRYQLPAGPVTPSRLSSLPPLLSSLLLLSSSVASVTHKLAVTCAPQQQHQRRRGVKFGSSVGGGGRALRLKLEGQQDRCNAGGVRLLVAGCGITRRAAPRGEGKCSSVWCQVPWLQPVPVRQHPWRPAYVSVNSRWARQCASVIVCPLAVA